MKKLLLSLLTSFILCTCLFGQSCPDCNTVSFTKQNATGYGCNGELFVNFNITCPTQIQITGLDYNGTPVNIIDPVVSPPYGHYNLKAGNYSYQLSSYDGLTLQCSTAVFPFTITQPACDFDLQYQFGFPDYCTGLIPVSVWSNNQGCTNTQNSIFNKMIINGSVSFSNQPVIIDMPLSYTDSFTVYNSDFINGSLQSLCSENITITSPGCNFAISLVSAIGSKCDNHKITATQTGDLCSGFWSADLYLNSVYDTTIFSYTNQIQFTNLGNGNYDVVGNSGVCFDSKNISLNYCPKPYGTLATEITANSAKVKWTKQTCAIGYQVQYRVLGTTPWVTKSVTTNTGSKVLSSLLPSSTYQWKVKTKCQNVPAFFSVFSSVKTFTTLSMREQNNSDNSFSAENSISNFSIAPNPVKEKLVVSFDSEDQNADFLILNVTGQIILKETVTLTGGNPNYSMNLEKLASGMYLVMVKTENGLATKRFLKE